MRFQNALVTGGAGFIGSHLCEALVQRGVRTRALDNLSMGRRENLPAGVELLEGDVLDPKLLRQAMEGSDAVFHLAARVSIRASATEFVEDARTNVMGTLGVLRGAAEMKVRKVVFASSMAVYGEAEYSPQDENHPARPISPYGVGKLASEQYCLLISRLAGFDAVALRYFNTYGTRQTLTPYVGVITIFVHRLLSGERPIVFGDGEQVRDFVHVGDVAEATVRAMESQASGVVINLGTGQGTSVGRLAEILVQKLDPSLPPAYGPPPPGEARQSVADTRRCRNLLGFVPPARLEEKLDEVIEFLRIGRI